MCLITSFEISLRDDLSGNHHPDAVLELQGHSRSDL